MKTQGISIIMQGMTNAATGKSTKVNDSAFDSFMTNHASKVGGQNVGKADFSKDITSDAKDMTVGNSGGTSKQSKTMQDKVSGQPNDNQKLVLTESGQDTADVVETLDVSEMTEQAMVLLQQTFGLSEEDLQDILGQLGIQLQDLLFQFQNGMVSAVNKEALQALVMEVHGISDAAAFLTNSVLSDELSSLTEQMTELVAGAFGVEKEELSDVCQMLAPDFMERLEQAVITPEDNSTADENLLSKDSAMSDTMGKISVVVEDASGNPEMEEGSTGSQTETSAQTETVSASAGDHTEAENALNLFTDRLSKAFEQNGVETTASVQRTMTHIVEQIVTQIKIRVLPETTSMELQLNPASLGRVNLQVSSANGVATATLTVENQMAKEALESQMITLKETFDEQGLKVDAVEVTVSEFGLKRDNGQPQQEQAGKKSGNRRFRPEAGMETETEDDIAVTGMTETARRDVNSVVDYTA